MEPVRNEAISVFNEKLGKFGLLSFQHRFVNKIFNFTHKLIYEKESPEVLRNIVINRDKVVTRELRNGKIMTDLPVSRSACATFEFFFTRFLNHFSYINFSLDLTSFKYFVNIEINSIFDNFILLFPKFDLTYNTYVHFKKKKKKLLT